MSAISRLGMSSLPPSMSQTEIERRRAHLWATVFIVLIGLGLCLAVLSVPVADDSLRQLIVTQPGFRYGLVVALIGFGGYVFDTERALRRLQVTGAAAELLAASHCARLDALTVLDQIKSEFVTTFDTVMSRRLETLEALLADLEPSDPVVRALAAETRHGRDDLRHLVEDHDLAVVSLVTRLRTQPQTVSKNAADHRSPASTPYGI